MTSHPVPDDALDDRLGIVGNPGSGKTYGAGIAVERILAAGGRRLRGLVRRREAEAGDAGGRY